MKGFLRSNNEKGPSVTILATFHTEVIFPSTNQASFMKAKKPIIALTLMTLAPTIIADLPSWRTSRNGVYKTSNAPTEWESKLLYETPLPSKSNGTPILVEDRLVFTAEPALLICADRDTGKIIWERSNDLMELNNLSDQKREALQAHKARIADVERGIQKMRSDVRRLERTLDRDPDNQGIKTRLEGMYKESQSLNAESAALIGDPEFRQFVAPPAHNTNGYSSYTPYYDGNRLYAVFGLGVVVAYDLDGNRFWSKFIEHPDHRWGGATMPQIVDGKLIVRFDDYVALNPKNGDEIWRAPSEVVFGTPAPFQVEGKSFLFTPRGEVIRVSDGKVIQEGLVFLHATRDWSIFNTPSVVGDLIYTVSGVEKANGDAYAYRIPKSLDTLNKKGLELVWHTEVAKDRYYSSPLIHKGLLYIVTRENKITVLEANNGRIVYTHEIKGARGTAYPSMTLAGGKIYLGIDDGHMVIFKPGKTFEEIARHSVGPYRSTPLFTDKAVYLRTYESLQSASSLK